MLPRAHRLRRNAEIRHVRRIGRRHSHPLLLLFAAESDAANARFAVTVSTRVGNAVVRNRVRRRIREAIRKQLGAVQPGWDFLFVARQSASLASYLELDLAVRQLLNRCGVLTSQTME